MLAMERCRRFPGREGQKYPLVYVVYNREEGMVKSIVSVSVDDAVLIRMGDPALLYRLVTRARVAIKGCKVVEIKDYQRVKFTELQRELLIFELVLEFWEARGDCAWSRSL